MTQPIEIAWQVRDFDILVPLIAEREAVATLTIVPPSDDQTALVGIGQERAISSRDFDRRCWRRILGPFRSHGPFVLATGSWPRVSVSPIVSITEPFGPPAPSRESSGAVRLPGRAERSLATLLP